MKSIEPIYLSSLESGEVNDAAGMLARSMRDLPLHIAIFGPNADRRESALTGVFQGLLPAMDHPPLCARIDGRVIGLAGMADSHAPQVPISRQLRLLLPLLRYGPSNIARLLGYLGEIQRHVTRDPHWHIGPVGVDPDFQGQGVGTELMEELCRRMERAGSVMCLEADVFTNVLFYAKFGFVTVEEQDIQEIHNWFMRREAQKATSSK